MKKTEHLFQSIINSSVEIKDFNALIDGKVFLMFQERTKKKYAEKLLK